MSHINKLRIRNKVTLSILAILFTLLLIGLVAIVLGWDQGIIDTKLYGQVINNEGEAIAGVQINFQGQKTVSDENGTFSFNNLRYGMYELAMNKNGFLDYKENVRLTRFTNEQKFTLDYLEFGSLEIKFDGMKFNEPDLDLIKVNINDASPEFDLNEEGKILVNTGSLLIGEYRLRVRSSLFDDINKKLVIQPGRYSISVKLKEAADLRFQLLDAFSTEPIYPEKFSLFINGEDDEAKLKELNGTYELTDIRLPASLTIKAEQAGYLPLTKKVELEAGINNLGKLFFYEDKKFIVPIYNPEQNQSTIVSTDLTGETQVALAELPGDCEVVVYEERTIIFQCQSTFYIFDTQTGRIISSYSYSASSGFYHAKNNKIFIADQLATRLAVIDPQTNKSRKILTTNQPITSLIVSDDERIFYSTNQGVFETNLKGKLTKQLTNGVFKIIELRGSKIVMTNGSNKNNLDIWILDVDKATKEKVTGISNNYTDIRFINRSQIIYRSTNFKSDVLSVLDVNSKVVTILDDGIDSFIEVIDKTYIIASKEEKIVVYKPLSNSQIEVEIKL